MLRLAFIIYVCSCYAFLAALAFARESTMYATGDATKIVASVPMITPRIIANTKLRIESPPRMKITTNTNKVDNEVMIVRPRVELIDLLMVVKKSCFG